MVTVSLKLKSAIIAVVLLLNISAPSVFAAETYRSGVYTYTLLGDGAAEITSVDIDEEQTELAIPAQLDGYTVTSLGYYALNNNSRLEHVTLPDTLKSIGNGAFSLVRNLREINLPDSLNDIGTAAFFGCDSLIEIVIPDGVTSIGDTAFRQCRLLEKVVIPNSVTLVGKMAFFDCDNLSEIKVPESVSQIGDMALGYYLDDEVQALEDFRIIGASGSAAESYALQNGFEFVPAEGDNPLFGDVNKDGRVSIRDVTTIQLGLANKITMNEEQQKVADVNCDNKIDINDCTLIQLYLARLIVALPID